MAHIIVDMYDGKLNPITGISDEAVDKLYFANLAVENLIRYYSLGRSVSDAYNELLEWRPSRCSLGGALLLRDVHKAERLTRSFLFEFRTALDHMEAAIKHDFGDQSKEWGIFTEGTNNAYDQVMEYAFTYHLRNCAQHCTNIVHGFYGASGSCISSNKEKLLNDYDRWNAVDKQFMAGCDANIDLILVFEKAWKAFNTALVPLIQHFLDEGNTLEQLWYLRMGDHLRTSFKKDVSNFYLMTPILPSGEEANLDDWKHGKADSLDAYLIAWDEIYELTNRLADKNGNVFSSHG